MDNTRVLLRSRLNVGFNLNYFSFFFANLVHLELFFFTLHVSKKFYQRMNKPNIHNNIIGDISSFENGLHDLFNSTGFHFKSIYLR